jgi:hypothetical protein
MDKLTIDLTQESDDPQERDDLKYGVSGATPCRLS